MSNENELVIKIDQTGADKTAQAIGKVTAATKENAKVVETQAKATKAASVDIGKFGGALGIAGNTIGAFNSTAGQMVSRVGAATGAIQALTTVALGPMGIALAAINVAVMAGTSLMADYGKEAEVTKRKIDDLKRSLSDLIGEQQRQAAEEELLARVRGGRGNVQEQRGYLASVQQQQAAARLGLEQLDGEAPTVASGEYGAFMARRREFEQQLMRLSAEEADARRRVQEAEENARLVAENASARRALAYEAEIAEGEGRIGGGAAAPRGGRRGAATAARGDNVESLMGRMGARGPFDADAAAFDEMMREREEQWLLEAEAAVLAQKERDALVYEERMAAEEKVTQLLADEEERRREAAAESDRQRVESYQSAARAIEQIGGTITSVYDFVSAAGASADESAEARQKRELKRIAFAQSVEAIVNAARSAAAFATQDYVGGAAYAVASGLNIAAAAKAGVDAGNVPRTSGASSGGGMSRDNASRGSGSQGAGTIVINMNGPVIAASDRAELGRQLGQIINEGAGRYGA